MTPIIEPEKKTNYSIHIHLIKHINDFENNSKVGT